jgi:hypothetical protein
MLVMRARGLGNIPPGAPRGKEEIVPDIAEMDSYAMLCEDWGSAYRITRTGGAEHPYRAERRDDPAVILAAASPGGLRELIRADYAARPVPREVAP